MKLLQLLLDLLTRFILVRPTGIRTVNLIANQIYDSGRWKSDIRSLVDASAATNGFIKTLIDHWKPMCDSNNRSVCSRGFAIHGNLPALCEHANHFEQEGCKYSVYNSGGPIPPLSRNASFLVYRRPGISSNNRTVLGYPERCHNHCFRFNCIGCIILCSGCFSLKKCHI